MGSNFPTDEGVVGVANTLEPLISNFLTKLEYQPPQIHPKDALRTAISIEAAKTGVPFDDSRHSRSCFETGVSVAGDMYPNHPLQVQIHIGVFTWLGFLIDDTNLSMASDLEHFQQRFYTGERQPTLLLESFSQTLRATYKFYDPIVANFIVLSALAFVNANTLETRQEIQDMASHQAAINWPYYFREKEGLPEVYAYFTFPKVSHPDISCFLQAIPDMGRCINLTNDILSFHKEEVAGETRNYVHNRANCEGRKAPAVLRDVVTETINAYKRASEVLKESSEYAEAWRAYMKGYVAMHFLNDRYKLLELGVNVTGISS